jgi:hypothetical protein
MIYFTLIFPLLIAGIVRVFTDKYKILPIPIDLGLTIEKRTIFGKNKTFGGFLILILVSGLTGQIFLLLFASRLDVKLEWYYGYILGLFYQLGELINSFIKRRLNIESGNSGGHFYKSSVQYIIDHLDSSVSLFILGLIWKIPLEINFNIFIYGSILHLMVDIINHLYGSKRNSDKHGINSFYQLILFWILFPFKIFVSGGITLETKSRPFIITSNHPSRFDPFIILLALNWHSYSKICPYKIVIYNKYLYSWYGIGLRLLGGIPSRWKNILDDRPIAQIRSAISANYSVMIFYEGKMTQAKVEDEKIPTGMNKIMLNSTNIPIKIIKIEPRFIFGWSVVDKGWVDGNEYNLIKCINTRVYDF